MTSKSGSRILCSQTIIPSKSANAGSQSSSKRLWKRRMHTDTTCTPSCVHMWLWATRRMRFDTEDCWDCGRSDNQGKRTCCGRCRAWSICREGKTGGCVFVWIIWTLRSSEIQWYFGLVWFTVMNVLDGSPLYDMYDQVK